MSHTLALVLIVEHDPAVAAELSACMSSAGCATLVAHGAEEAVALTRSCLPDLVLLDLDLRGNPLGDSIRKLLVSPGRIIAMTADAASEARTRAEGTGIALVLGKPVDQAELRVLATELLQGGTA